MPKLATVEDEEDSELDASDLLEPYDVAITEPPETNRSRSKLQLPTPNKEEGGSIAVVTGSQQSHFTIE